MFAKLARIAAVAALAVVGSTFFVTSASAATVTSATGLPGGSIQLYVSGHSGVTLATILPGGFNTVVSPRESYGPSDWPYGQSPSTVCVPNSGSWGVVAPSAFGGYCSGFQSACLGNKGCYHLPRAGQYIRYGSYNFETRKFYASSNWALVR